MCSEQMPSGSLFLTLPGWLWCHGLPSLQGGYPI